MTPSQIEAARALVASPHFRWMRGMLVMSDPQKVPRVAGSPVCPSDLRARVVSAVLGRWFGVGEFCVDHPDAENEPMSDDDLPGTLPDLDDPATLGCLLALAREAWDEPRAHTVPSLHSAIWFFYDGEGCGPLGIAPSEGEAIAAAILAATVKP